MIVTRRAPERRRLRDLVRAAPPATETATVVLGRRYAAFDRADRLRRRSPRQAEKLRRRLVAAGYTADSMAVFSAIELGCAAAGAVLPLVAFGVPEAALPMAAAGLMLPRIVLARRAERRKRLLRNGLPDALDLVIVCLDAGCTLTHAFARVSEELRGAHPDLAHELSIVTAETQAGKPKAEVFQNLWERTQLDEIRPIASLLVQAERMGTGIGQALRTHAETSRDKRRQRAEEEASKAGIKMVFPLVLCIFPAFYIITLGPVVIHFIRVFSGNEIAVP
jgi:tight adherence protein C